MLILLLDDILMFDDHRIAASANWYRHGQLSTDARPERTERIFPTLSDTEVKI